jgi:hypothetical protein
MATKVPGTATKLPQLDEPTSDYEWEWEWEWEWELGKVSEEGGREHGAKSSSE